MHFLGSGLHLRTSLAVGGGDPLIRTFDDAALRINYPGNYILLDTAHLKLQATVDYGKVQTSEGQAVTSVFTRFAFYSYFDSVRVEVKSSGFNSLSFTTDKLDGDADDVQSRIEGFLLLIFF